FFFQAEDGIRDGHVTGVQTCALPIYEAFTPVKKFNPDEPLRCSFCHKTQEQVEKLISSPSDYPRAYICNECVGVCQTILEDEKRSEERRVGKECRSGRMRGEDSRYDE